MYISQFDELSAFCERVGSARTLAVDTEFLRERTYYPKLCLIQVATHDESASIDPLVLDDLSPLRDLLVDDRITKVIHACSQDLEVILDFFGVMVSPVFDTQLAAAFLGLRQQVGYGVLVERYTGVHLPKADSLTDWSRRPLDAEQLAYAEDDVRFLPGIYDAMMTQLVAKNRLGWLMPEMGALTDRSRFERAPERAYLHLRRSASLTRRQLAVAREVAAWRERRAAARDVPRKWVIPDEILVEVSKRCPRTVDRLRRIRGTDGLSARDAEELARAVRKGMALDLEDLPVPRRRERASAEAEGAIDLMYALLRVVADKAGVAPQLIATRDDLVDLVLGREGCRLATGWRHELAGRPLERLLAGEIGLTVKGGRVEVL
ncbi:MAG: ribonuclease D [Acidobacteriota bacterium]|nr:ribonuclease D [Acidobacteriota bacterium]